MREAKEFTLEYEASVDLVEEVVCNSGYLKTLYKASLEL
jgi:hypothetical protein